MKEVFAQYSKNAVGLLSILLLLPGCSSDWLPWGTSEKSECCSHEMPKSTGVQPSDNRGGFISPDDKSEVLAYLDGQPAVTRQQIKDLKEAPQIKQLLAMAPEDIVDVQLMQGLINKAALRHHIVINKIDMSPEYRKKFDAVIDSGRVMLDMEFFGQTFPVTVSDAEVRAFYDENKDKIPQFMISHGGVNAACVRFEKEDEARNFMAKVEELNGDVKRAVQDMGLTGKFTDFMLINELSSAYDPALRARILAMQNIPGTEVCQVGDSSFYVVTASGKEDTMYQPYELVKKQLRDYLEGEKRKQMSQIELNKLVDEYKITKSKAGEALEQRARAQESQMMPSSDVMQPTEE